VTRYLSSGQINVARLNPFTIKHFSHYTKLVGPPNGFSGHDTLAVASQENDILNVGFHEGQQ
jgi:hypothetical protein